MELILKIVSISCCIYNGWEQKMGKKNNLPIIDGHKKGAEIIKKIVRKSIKLNIKYLTFYGFSMKIGIEANMRLFNCSHY